MNIDTNLMLTITLGMLLAFAVRHVYSILIYTLFGSGRRREIKEYSGGGSGKVTPSTSPWDIWAKRLITELDIKTDEEISDLEKNKLEKHWSEMPQNQFDSILSVASGLLMEA
jgi:hypothetical protein